LRDIAAEDLADGRCRRDAAVEQFAAADVKCTWDLLTGRAAE
jgi:hypothetical protein